MRHGETVTLSTGHRIDLPASLSATIAGAVLPVARGDAAALLPDGLAPIRATPSTAAITLLSVVYRRVGDDAMPPYREVGVLVPAVEAGTWTVPYLSALTRGVSGYVQYLPVTTEPARAFGAEIWGYPKVVADVDVEDAGRTRLTSVSRDGRDVLSFTIERPRTVPARLSGYNYTVRDGQLLRERTALRGRVGVRPADDAVTVAVGEHPDAAPLRDCALGERALVTLSADCEFVIEAGAPVRR